jgi:hypothetical protein
MYLFLTNFRGKQKEKNEFERAKMQSLLEPNQRAWSFGRHNFMQSSVVYMKLMNQLTRIKFFSLQASLVQGNGFLKHLSAPCVIDISTGKIILPLFAHTTCSFG